MNTKVSKWSEQETMMAKAFVNIANSLPYISKMMNQHVKSVQNGGGIITDGDLEEALSKLADMINKNLYNVSQSRVSFNLTPIAPTRKVNESYKKCRKVRLKENDLRNIISESIRQMINEHGRGNDWNKRVEWNAFQDPLVIKSRQRNNTHSVRSLLQKIINSPWWKILRQNGCRPDFQCVITAFADEIDTLDSNDIEEIMDFYEHYEDGRDFYTIHIYCHTDNIGDNVKNPAIENIIYAAGEGCFNIQDYDYFEPRINDVLKEYINKKRLNNV